MVVNTHRQHDLCINQNLPPVRQAFGKSTASMRSRPLGTIATAMYFPAGRSTRKSTAAAELRSDRACEHRQVGQADVNVIIQATLVEQHDAAIRLYTA
jgi:hypothetical protein